MEESTEPCWEKHCAMVDGIQYPLNLTSVKYQAMPEMLDGSGCQKRGFIRTAGTEWGEFIRRRRFRQLCDRLLLAIQKFLRQLMQRLSGWTL